MAPMPRTVPGMRGRSSHESSGRGYRSRMTALQAFTDTTARPPAWLRAGLARLEGDARLDGAAERLRAAVALLDTGLAGDALGGEWLGHALHPLLTDVPLGCWMGAGLLDVVGGRRSRRAARRLVGLGLLAVPLTVATGLVDWSRSSETRVRRVGVVHAGGNVVVAA